MSIKKERCTAVILAGGASKRMGKNKALLEIEGKTVIERILERLIDFSEVLISANNEDDYKEFGYRIIKDIFIDCGPLAGIHSCLKAAENEYVFFAPCDMPYFSEKLIDFAFSEISVENEACVFRDEFGRIHALCGLYKKSLINELELALRTGKYKAQSFAKEHNFKVIDVPRELSQALFNMNVLEDYNKVKNNIN